MSLDLGAVVGRVILDDTEFQQTIRRDTGLMREFSVQAGKASSGTEVLDESLGAVSASANKASGSLGRASKSANENSAAETKAAQASARHAEALTAVNRVVIEYSAASSKSQQAALRDAAAQQRLAAARSEAGSAEARQATETARVATAQASAIGSAERLAAANRGLGAAQGEAAAASRGLASGFGSTLKMAAGLGVLVGGFEVIKKAIDVTKEANEFQRSMVQVQTTADVTAGEVKKASGALLSMAGPVAAAPNELATAWYHAKSVGLDYSKSIDTTRIAAEGSRVGHANLEETMNALTSTVASGIPGVENMAGAMGQLIATVGTGDMKLSDLNEALSSGILTVVKGYGLSLTDVGAALATFGDNNIRGANAATMLRLSVQAMAVPAKGGIEALHGLGLTTDQLAKDMQSGGLNKAILDLKSHLDDAGVSSVQTGAVLTEIFGKRAGPGLQVLVGQVDRLESKFKILRSSGVSFDEKWKATTQTASYALASFGHGAEAAGIRLTATLGPAIAVTARDLTGTLRTGLQIAGDAVRPLVAAGHALAPALGAVGHAAGSAGRFLSPLAPVLKFIAADVLATWAAFKGYQIVMAAASAIRTFAVAQAANFRGAVTAVRSYGSAVTSTLAGTGSASAVAAARMESDFAQLQAATMQSVAVADRAAAGQAEAYALMVAASDDATATMISNSQNMALAASEQAAASEVAAAEMVTSAEAAAAGVAAAGEEAAVGWAGLLGPLAAVGIGIALLTTLFHHNSDSEKTSKAASDSYAQSLQQNSNALAAVNTQASIKQLQDTKSIHLLHQLHDSNAALGVSQGDLVLAVNKGGQAYDQLHAQLQKVIAANTEMVKVSQGQNQYSYVQEVNDTGKAAQSLSDNIDTLRHSFSKQQKQQILAQQVERQAQALADGGAGAAARQARALGLTSNAYLDAQTAAKQNTDQTRIQTAAFQAENDAASLLQQALDGLAGVNLSVATAQTSLASANLQVRSSFKDNGAAINGNTQAAVNNQQAIQSQVSAAQQYAEAVGKQTHSSVKAKEALKASQTALEDQLRAQGKLTPAVQKYIEKLYNIKNLKVPPTKLDADTAAGNAKIKALQDRIDAIKQGKRPGLTADNSPGAARIAELQVQINNLRQHNDPTINVQTEAALAKIAQLQLALNNIAPGQTRAGTVAVATSGGPGGHHAAGGTIRGPGTGTSDSVLMWGSNGEEVVNAKQSAKHRPLIKAINAGTDGFAKGGTVGGIAAAQSWVRAQNSHRYDYGAAGPGGWDCSGLVGGALLELLGKNPNHRIFSTSNEGSVLRSYGFRNGAGNGNDAMVVGWANGEGGLHHTTGSVGGLKFEAYGDNGVPLKDQIRVGANARDPRSFPHVMHLPNRGGKFGADTGPGGDRPGGGGAGASKAKQAAKDRASALHSLAGDSAGLSGLVGQHTSVHGNRLTGKLSSVGDIASGLRSVEGDARQAGLSKAFIQSLTGQNRGILAAAKSRNQAAAQLARANTAVVAALKLRADDAASFKSAVVGSFDITSAGADSNGRITAGSLRAAQAQQFSRVRAWVPAMRRLIGMRIFPRAYLRQLLGAGPSSLPTVRALLGMPKAEMAQFAANNVEINRLGTSIGTAGSRNLDNGRIKTAQDQQRMWQQRENRREAVLERRFAHLEATILHAYNSQHMEAKLFMKHGELYLAVESDKRKVPHRGKVHSG